MPIYEYTCPDCSTQFEELARIVDRKKQPCPACDGVAKQVIRTPAKPNWPALAMGPSASPEAIDRFDRNHRKQAEKERAILLEHGSL